MASAARRREFTFRAPSEAAFDAVLGRLWPEAMFVNIDGLGARIEAAEIVAVVRITSGSADAGDHIDLELRRPKDRLELVTVRRRAKAGQVCIEEIGREVQKKDVVRAVAAAWRSDAVVTASEELTLRYGLRDASKRTEIVTVRAARRYAVGSGSGGTARPVGCVLSVVDDDGARNTRFLRSDFFKTVLEEIGGGALGPPIARCPALLTARPEAALSYEGLEKLFRDARRACHRAPER